MTGPKVIRWDFNFVKRIPVAGPLNLEFQVQVFNVFNRVNFNPVGLPTASANAAVLDNYQVTGAVDQARTGQMAFRISW